MKKNMLSGIVFALWFLSAKYAQPEYVLHKNNNVSIVYKSNKHEKREKIKNNNIKFINSDLENKIERDINKHLDSILYLYDEKNKRHNNFYSNKTVERINKYSNIIDFYSKKYSVNQNLVKAIIAVESDGKPRKKSPAGAKGLMQLMNSTAKEYGDKNINIFNPEQNIRTGIKYLAHLYKEYISTEEVLIHYNCSSNGVNKAKKRAKNNNYWVYKDYFIGKEPKEYVPKVLAWKRFFDFNMFNESITPKSIQR